MDDLTAIVGAVCIFSAAVFAARHGWQGLAIFVLAIAGECLRMIARHGC